MIRVAILGSGNVGHALGALLGSRPELDVVLWGRRLPRRAPLTLRCFGVKGTYALGTVLAEPLLRRAISGAEVVVLALPAHVRDQILAQACGRLRDAALLVAWEGLGRFSESLREHRIDGPIAVGLQRSPLLCRTRRRWHSVEIHGVRSRVVAATIESADRLRAKAVLDEVFPFRFIFAPNYTCVSLSPGNPLIHPARLYSFAQSGATVRRSIRFYADWNDEASKTLLALHGEVAQLREALRLPRKYVDTLADGRTLPSLGEITQSIRSEPRLARIVFPVRMWRNRLKLDHRHRFFREDIGEGLAYMLSIAHSTGVQMPMASTIHAWYRETKHS